MRIVALERLTVLTLKTVLQMHFDGDDEWFAWDKNFMDTLFQQVQQEKTLARQVPTTITKQDEVTVHSAMTNSWPAQTQEHLRCNRQGNRTWNHNMTGKQDATAAVSVQHGEMGTSYHTEQTVRTMFEFVISSFTS